MKKGEMHYSLFIFSAVMLILSLMTSGYSVYAHGFIEPYATLMVMNILGALFAAYIFLTEV